MRRALVPLLLFSCSAPSVVGESTPLPDLLIGEHVFSRRQLANGLRAVAIQDEGETTTVFMAVAAGTRNETAETTGLAHLTEHAMFAGTPTTGTDLHEKTIVDWGGESNAFTRDDYTMYYDHNFPPAELKAVLAMEADRLRNLSLAPAPTLHERYRLEMEEKHSYQPSDGREQTLEAVTFQVHPYRHGLRDDDGHTRARNLPVSAIRSFYDTYYRPNRVAVVVIGPGDPQLALDEIEASFASLDAGPAVNIHQEPIPSRSRREIVTSTLPRDRNVECWLIPEMGHPHRPALAVLATLMGRVDLSCGVPMSVGMGARIDRDWFRLDWSAADPGATNQARVEINTMLNSFREGTADLSGLDEVKGLMWSALEGKPLRARPYFALAGTVAWHESHHLAETLSAYGDDIRAVTAQDIKQVAQQWLPRNRSVTVVFAGTGVAVAPLPDSPRELRAAAAEASETGDYARAVAAYGLLLEKMPDKMNTVINYAERGMLFMEMKDFDSAIADFEAALVVTDYPAVRDLLEEAHARKARALRGDFETEGEEIAEDSVEEVEELDLESVVQATMRELEEWRGLSFTATVVPEFVDVSAAPDEKLGGWYETDTKRLVVVTGKENGDEFTRGAQLHEIFHALQDQTWNLSDLDQACETTDQMHALQGLVEGEAMLAVSDLMNYDFAQHSQIPKTGEIDREKFEKLFHYGVGLSFVQMLRNHGGWDAVDGAWGEIPQSTSELYHPLRYPSAYADSMMAGPAGEILETDCLGEFELRWLLVEDEATRPLADTLGAALVGDTWFKVASPGAEHPQEVWNLRFSNEGMAKLFSGAKIAFVRESWTVSQAGLSVTLQRQAQ